MGFGVVFTATSDVLNAFFDKHAGLADIRASGVAARQSGNARGIVTAPSVCNRKDCGRRVEGAV